MLVAKKELDYYYPEQVNTQDERPKRVGKSRKKKSRAASKLLIIGVAIFGLVLSLFILYRYANITKIRGEITELEKQKLELEKEKEHLIAELEGIKSSSKIEEDAVVKLGMDYPTEEQIVYMDVNDFNFEDKKDITNGFFFKKQLTNFLNLVLGMF